MTSFSKLHKLQRQQIFAPAPAAPEAPRAGKIALRAAPTPPVPLLVQGQGTFIFKHRDQPAAAEPTPLAVAFRTEAGQELARLDLDAAGSRLTVGGREVAASPQSLVVDGYAYYWLSLDYGNGWLRFGLGEARLETEVLHYQLTKEERKACREVTQLHLGPAVEKMRLLRDPIVTTVPLEVRGTERLTMDDIARNRYLPQAALPPACRQLYDTIAGPNFVLDADDFPELSQAIKYSIETPGCWCFEKLADKQKTAPRQHQVYLRITLGHNGGESPGIPFVMEIWPPQCFSAIHQHAGANAVIRVLHGRIHVTMFPYLRPAPVLLEEQPAVLPEAAFAFGERSFEQGAITWISPLLNQIHRLRNPEPLGAQPCITIQCYQYDEDDAGHYPFFDYDRDESLHQFEPDSDMDFVAFKAQMRREWLARPVPAG
ncbi:cysteine dioxygenase family protein [Hymenobacter sp. ASUV-10]|uniref:Cysteine dioxygenase family protein n=1 Tax=Hymenobacter aranciens TaxID=3063996 RepID=A0ABT9BEU6_9BACT|nr:cysteine dioxygenase family protein [Hymenobacter sp. ASUV-10]MDO7876796.1 cysteine dioxygenase family protein [Hymenobacter sp. ASUV-10]